MEKDGTGDVFPQFVGSDDDDDDDDVDDETHHWMKLITER